MTGMHLLNQVFDFFNWKKNPKNVLYQALPLGVLGLGYMMTGAVLRMVWFGNPWFLVIFLVITGFSSLVLFGMWRNYQKVVNPKPDTPEMTEAERWRDWETYERLRKERVAKEAKKDRLLMNVIVGYGGALIAAVLILPLVLGH